MHLKNLDDITTKYGNEEEIEGYKGVESGDNYKQVSIQKNINSFAQAKVQLNKKYFNS